MDNEANEAYVTALTFLNALRDKNVDALKTCFAPEGTFQDVLPNGTLVTSADELLKLHVGFMQNEKTGFRPFNKNNTQSKWRFFCADNLESIITFDSGYFCRIAAEVDRPMDFRIADSKVERYYMYLGILVKDHYVVHVQNTLFDPAINTPQ